jgi:uncharacterized protein (DUF736 family)
MATIGSFKKVGNDFQGAIITLNLQAKSVRIVAETNRTNENAPSHRIYVGRAEIGAAWSKRSEEGRDYLSLKLDDPSFIAPIYANLFDDEGGEGFTLLWSRPRKNGAYGAVRPDPARFPGGVFASSKHRSFLCRPIKRHLICACYSSPVRCELRHREQRGRRG